MPRIKQVAQKCTKERFSSSDAEARFEELYSEKQCLADLGFILTGDTPYPLPTECRDVIRILGWEQFCAQMVELDLSIVREFLWPNSVHSIFVRERSITLNPRAINQLFNLMNYINDSDDFYFYLADDETCDKILQEVTVPGTQWSLSKQGNKTCRREFLTDEAKIWFYFIRHSLMPTGHTSSLNVEGIILLACIVKARTINVGKLICEQIRDCARKRSGEMFFPTLICLLCRAFGVKVAIEDDDFYPQGTIFAYDLSRIIPPAPQPHPPDNTPAAQTPFSATTDAPATTSTDAPATTTTDVTATTMAHILAQLQIYWTYAKERDAAYLKALSRQRQHAGNPWPIFPTQLLPEEDQDKMDDDVNIL